MVRALVHFRRRYSVVENISKQNARNKETAVELRKVPFREGV